MLHKSFKPAKCKTSLKLATSRIKLMRNKKGVQINQMKRDLAQLLETGQDRTARIRVEHVIREEKMVAAYDLIEIYCELIVARMPIIESQKTCPIDLKEAVTSVIFAAPRCSDISELADIKKQFTAKFGKEFVSAALELRPESGVSRMLVEKLSAVAPDIKTKVKVLTGVAKEHNIEWEPTSFEEKESNLPNDLLASQSLQMGPADLEIASMVNANPGPTKIQPSNINHEKKRDPPLDFAQQNRKFVVDNNVVGTSSSASERMEGQNWNMGFKDATSAAEAAAESAERAAMAARAAAHFASHEKIPDKKSFGDGKPKINYQQMDRGEHEEKDNETVDEASKRSNKSNSSTESKTELGKGKKEGDRKPKITNQQIDPNEHGQKDTERFQEADTRSSKSSSFIESENVNFFAEEASRRQPSVVSSRSGYEVDDEVVSDDHEVGKRSVVGNPFAVVDQRNLFSESTKSKSGLDDQRDDDDDDGPKFDIGYEYDEVESSHSLENAHIWSPRKKERSKNEETRSTQSHIFSESLSFGKHSVKSSETDDRVPVSFDHSDSESEGNNKFNDILSASSEPLSRKYRIELNDLVEGESSFYDHEDEERKQPSSSILLEKHELKKHEESFEDSNESLNRSSNDLDTGKELNFGKLTGGLRHKGGVFRYPPPYTKTAAATDALDLSNKESSMIGDEITVESRRLDSKVSTTEDKKPSVSKSSSESDLDDYSEKFLIHSSKTRSRFSPPVPFFDDDDDDDKEGVLKEASSSSARLRSELSRRTRGSPSVSSSKRRVDPPKPKTVISSSSQYSDSDQTAANARKTQQKPRNENHSVINAKEEAIKKMQMPERNSDESGKTTREKLGSERVSVDNNLVKKPSYVHPKMPDYDTFAARLQSLRDERK